MLKKLDIDQNPNRWADALMNYQENKAISCPICSSTDIEVQAACGSDLVGYIAFTCKGCGKTGYISRVKFDAIKEGMGILQSAENVDYSQAV